jgi:NitT/TauT family transport system ATP-binding protein
MTNATLNPAREILVARNVCRSFDREREGRMVLDGVDLELREGEIVGLLGRSGSGKSTLLRVIAGLIPPSSGRLEYRGEPLSGPAPGVSMVFQTFALFPWLTVLDNVETGLEALGMPARERRERALAAIDLIGLDGFENAFPRELSGGMRQRVGFARALVVDPTLLLMDEPFSALDVLTAETLRTDLLDLWTRRRLSIKSVLIVTHNIEEAVFMCDRILLLSSNPGRVIGQIEVPFAHRRDRLDPAFRELVDDIYAKMTARPSADAAHKHRLEVGSPLSRVSTNLMAGLVEAVAAEPYRGKADLSELGSRMQLEIDELFPVAEMLGYLGLATLHDGDFALTPAGLQFNAHDTQGRKRLFADHLLRNVPLARYIRSVLAERRGQSAPRARFEQKLEDFLSESKAAQTLEAVIDWGRYAEAFSYDDQTGMFALEDAGPE